MPFYQKIPVIVQAVQWTGKNVDEVHKLAGGSITVLEDKVIIDTLEGVIAGKKSSYIIKGVKGEIYPCEEEIFNMTYRKVDDPEKTG